MTVEAERYIGEQRSRHYNTARSYAIRSVERNTSYIVMIIEARNIIFRIFLWHVLKIAGFICIPRRTNILSPFANPVYLVQFIRLQGSRLNFFKVLSPINVWRTFEFRDHRIKKNLMYLWYYDETQLLGMMVHVHRHKQLSPKKQERVYF